MYFVNKKVKLLINISFIKTFSTFITDIPPYNVQRDNALYWNVWDIIMRLHSDILLFFLKNCNPPGHTGSVRKTHDISSKKFYNICLWINLNRVACKLVSQLIFFILQRSCSTKSCLASRNCKLPDRKSCLRCWFFIFTLAIGGN